MAAGRPDNSSGGVSQAETEAATEAEVTASLKFGCPVCGGLFTSIYHISFDDCGDKVHEQVCESCLLWAVMTVEGLKRG